MGAAISVFKCDARDTPIVLEVRGRQGLVNVRGRLYDPERAPTESGESECVKVGTRLAVTSIDEYRTPHGESLFRMVACRSDDPDGEALDLSELLSDPRGSLSECPLLRPVDPFLSSESS